MLFDGFGDVVKALHEIGVKRDLDGTEVALELLDFASSDEHRGDTRLREEPCDGQRCHGLAGFVA